MAEEDKEAQRQEDIATVRGILEMRPADVLVDSARKFAERVHKTQVDGTWKEGNPGANQKWDAPRLPHILHGEVCMALAQEFTAMLLLLDQEKFSELHARSRVCRDRLLGMMPKLEGNMSGATLERDNIGHVIGPLHVFCGFLTEG